MHKNELSTPGTPEAAPPVAEAAPESTPERGADAPEQTERMPEDAPSTPSAPSAPPEQETPPDPDSLPLSGWKDGMVSLPEGIEADADMLAGFGEAAVAAGLTRRQAQALVDWQGRFQLAQAQARMDAGMDTLRKAWGHKAETNQKKVLGLVSRIDRALGDESFSRALGESGATLHAGVVLGLHKLAELMAEDSLGSAAGAAAEHDETPLEGLENALREARRGK